MPTSPARHLQFDKMCPWSMDIRGDRLHSTFKCYHLVHRLSRVPWILMKFVLDYCQNIACLHLNTLQSLVLCPTPQCESEALCTNPASKGAVCQPSVLLHKTSTTSVISGDARSSSSLHKIDFIQSSCKLRKMEFRHLLVVALFSILSSEWIAQSFGLSAKEFLDQTEVNLQLVVKKVEDNDRNECALVSTCSAVANCSRQSCSYDVTDVPNYSCQIVSENQYCNTSAECKWRNFNFRRSYVRASPTTDISSNETTMVICAQRELDEVFPTVSNATNNNQVYFGSVDGTTRTYPGADEFPCKYFDPRVRPWYLASLCVKKVVIVVIDIGFSMGEPINVGDYKSHNPLSTAQDLTRELMNTLSGSDYINIMDYDASGANLLAPNPVPVNDSNSDIYPPYHPEFDDLTTKLMNLAVGTANAGSSNLSLAMDTAISNMSPFKPEFVKIAIVLTDGALGDPTSPMWKNLKAAGVKLFVYKFQDPDGVADTSISDQQQVCNIGGSYESFPMTRGQNPLYALQSYYSFIANLHTKMNNSIVYGYVYDDYIQADSEIFSISLPVYDSSGVLLGVVGIDIHRSDVRTRLGITDSDFEAETIRRRIAYTFDATRDLVLDSTTCSNQTSAATSGAHNCGSDITIPPSGSLCAANDEGRSIAEFSCCKDCIATSGEKSKKPLVIGLSVGAILVLVLIVVGLFLVKRYKDKYEDENNRSFPDGYPPPPADAVVNSP